MARIREAAAFQWRPFSKKQKKVLTWWKPWSPYYDYDMIICDGAIRSGKTIAMITSFVMWATETFSGQDFIIAGKSAGALRRNVIQPMKQICNALNLPHFHHRGEGWMSVGDNFFHFFGANNEASQDALQGMTAAGAYADEVALFPQSFVEQMIGRCSIEGSRIWMNCNPEGPYHYIKTEFIDQAEAKKILRLHFTLDDNLSLSPKIKERYHRQFAGVFKQRFIYGQWVAAEGIVYPMFDHTGHVVDAVPKYDENGNPFIRKYWIGVDYGSSNATTFILCGLGVDGRFYVLDEYYHSGREEEKKAAEGTMTGTVKKSPSDYSRDFQSKLRQWRREYPNFPKRVDVYIDPTAEGFMLQLWKDIDEQLLAADNSLKLGIEGLQSLMSNDCFRVHRRCQNVLRELASYVWDEKAAQRGEDEPVKEHDHTLDAIRYVFNMTRSIWVRKGVVRNVA